MANFVANLYPNIAPIKYLVFIVMYGAAVPFYVALYQAFNLLQYIDENTAFSSIYCKVVKEYKALCSYNQWFVCIRFATFSFYSEENGTSYWVSGTYYHFCFVR
ncbi:DUF2975 domain-containing protein [Bacillus cereus]|uniref:DUF2975 domain-containing protein n=1 Tax=Bacillus cereus TaxID=1396 RepID=UPI003311D1CE|nr:DUF2975 domain-containing protein [Bacillus cereus]